MVEPDKEVLLKAAVEAFNDLIGKTGDGHVVAAGKDVYQQPPVYLTMHVIEMRAAGWQDADYDTVAAVSGASALFGYTPTDFGPSGQRGRSAAAIGSSSSRPHSSTPTSRCWPP